jgi:hypothetical protein
MACGIGKLARALDLSEKELGQGNLSFLSRRGRNTDILRVNQTNVGLSNQDGYKGTADDPWFETEASTLRN